MEFTRDYFVHYYEADSSHRLTVPALVQYLEDIAIVHSSSVGLDLAYYNDNACGWMLLKWEIKIDALPSFGDTVTVSTHVHSMKGFLADREFSVRSADGRPLAWARSNWLLVDTEKRRPMRVPQDQYERFGVTPESSPLFVAIDDVALPDTGVASALPVRSLAVSARHGDIDTNRHVNNARYLAWALDSLPGGFFDGVTPTALRANYRKELAEGGAAEVSTTVAEEGGVVTTSHAIRSGAEDLCRAEIIWKREE